MYMLITYQDNNWEIWQVAESWIIFLGAKDNNNRRPLRYSFPLMAFGQINWSEFQSIDILTEEEAFPYLI